MKKNQAFLCAALFGFLFTGADVSAEAPNDVTNLTYQQTPTKRFVYTEPAGEYKEIRVYRDGVYMGMTVPYGDRTVGDMPADNLLDYQTYRYRFVTVNHQGEWSKGVEYVLNTGNVRSPDAPSVYAGYPKETTTETSVKIGWSLSNKPNDFKEYEVYRDGVLLKTTTENTLTDGSLMPNHAYQYCVKAVDTGGLKSWCGSVKAITNPAVPKNIVATFSDEQVMVTWDHNQNSDATMYKWTLSEIDGMNSYSIYSSGYGEGTRKNSMTFGPLVRNAALAGRKFELTVSAVGDNKKESATASHIFVVPRTYADPKPPSEPTNSLAVYTVQTGDTLFGISRKFSMNVDELQTINSRISLMIYPGLKLWVKAQGESVPVPANPPVADTYTVKQGDTLYKISAANHLLVSDLMRINGLTSSSLAIGQVLLLQEKEIQKEQVVYVVQKGDTLYQISKRFGISVALIQETNNLATTDLRIGQTLFLEK